MPGIRIKSIKGIGERGRMACDSRELIVVLGGSARLGLYLRQRFVEMNRFISLCDKGVKIGIFAEIQPEIFGL